METTNNQPVKIAITDDHKMVVRSLSKLLNDKPEFRVEAVYYDLKSCRAGLSKALPDVLLLDIGLPDGDGVDFRAEITKIHPELKIIMLTSYKEFNVAKRALYNGALGYVLKNAEPEEIFAAIETVNKGEQFLCEEIDILLKDKINDRIIWYSTTEKDVLQYIADGLTTKEIGKKLYRAEDTIKTHRKNLLIKLDAKNTSVMIKKACEQNLVRF
jgi:DNA-binding NarL/FixJ family response regulator